MAIEYVDSTQLDSDLTSVADAIRAKGGTSGQLQFPGGFVDAVEAIETGGGAQNITFLDWANEAISSSSGSIASPNYARILCKHALHKFSSMVIPNGYDYAIFACKDFAFSSVHNGSGTYLGSWTGTIWAKSLNWKAANGTPVDFTSLTDWGDCFLTIVIRNHNQDTNISPSVGANVQFTYDVSNGAFYT